MRLEEVFGDIKAESRNSEVRTAVKLRLGEMYGDITAEIK
jgi:hypothetical protein